MSKIIKVKTPSSKGKTKVLEPLKKEVKKEEKKKVSLPSGAYRSPSGAVYNGGFSEFIEKKLRADKEADSKASIIISECLEKTKSKPKEFILNYGSLFSKSENPKIKGSRYVSEKWPTLLTSIIEAKNKVSYRVKGRKMADLPRDGDRAGGTREPRLIETVFEKV